MDDLDLLKKHWQKDNQFSKIDQTEIRSMLHRSSSSILKWIFIISIIELSLGILLNLIPSSPSLNFNAFHIIETLFSIVFYAVILYFIYQFFKNYTAIKNTDSTKVLLSKIIKTRKNVSNYIQFNILCFIFLFVLFTIDAVWKDVLLSTINNVFILEEFIKITISLLIAVLFIYLIRKIYKLLYLRLLKKLNKNYEELKNLSEE